MFCRMQASTVLIFFCISWLLGVNSASLAQDKGANSDLYGTGRGDNATAEPPSTSSDKITDLYGAGRSNNVSSETQQASPDKNTEVYSVERGNNRSLALPAAAPNKESDTYGRTNKTGQELPAADKTGSRDKESDLYSREIRAAQVIRVINRPPNIQGLTGLMVMNSAFTRPAGTLAVGGSFMFEDSNKPDYRIIQTPITLTIGITDSIEAGLKTKFVDYNRTTPKESAGGLGDSELAVKWRLKTHSATTPELAVGLAGIIPTGSNSKGLNDVTNWGLKFMVLATSETKISTNSFLGIYLETQAVFIDGFSGGYSTNTQDRYGVINAGVLLPISTSNQWQAMLELNNTVKKRNSASAADSNQSGITPAIRYVTVTRSFTAGAQILRKDTKGYDDTVRWIGTFSSQF